jgi:hypothetical protein
LILEQKAGLFLEILVCQRSSDGMRDEAHRSIYQIPEYAKYAKYDKYDIRMANMKNMYKIQYEPADLPMQLQSHGESVLPYYRRKQ